MSRQKHSQLWPLRHECRNSPGTPSVPSAPTASTGARTSGCTASGSSCGEPSATIPDTRSGRRTARPPPRAPPPEVAAAALANDRDLLLPPLGEQLHALLQPIDGLLGTAD